MGYEMSLASIPESDHGEDAGNESSTVEKQATLLAQRLTVNPICARTHHSIDSYDKTMVRLATNGTDQSMSNVRFGVIESEYCQPHIFATPSPTMIKVLFKDKYSQNEAVGKPLILVRQPRS